MTREKTCRIHDIEDHMRKINNILISIGDPSEGALKVFDNNMSASEVTVIIEALRRRRDSLARELDKM